MLVVAPGTGLLHAQAVVVEVSAAIGAAELLCIPGAGGPQHGGLGEQLGFGGWLCVEH